MKRYEGILAVALIFTSMDGDSGIVAKFNGQRHFTTFAAWEILADKCGIALLVNSMI